MNFSYRFSLVGDKTPLPSELSDPQQDEALFENEPWVEAPVQMEYGTNIQFGSNVYLNSNCALFDVCPISIGDRTLIGPNTSFMTPAHPLDPEIRKGTKGPEYGKPIHVGNDCWIGGNVTIVPGVTIGRGSVIGAGSVVTKV
jgi:acetyltransferase-like isoleucine patch superfamily enzyme